MMGNASVKESKAKIFDFLKSLIFTSKIYVVIGILLIIICMLPFLILGENSYLRIFDNLDSEILFYLLSGKYLSSLNGSMPEIMNGLSVGSVNVFSPIQIFTYMIMPTYWAYIFNDFWVRLVGFLGIYFLLKKIIGEKYCWLCLLTGMIFALLPIYSVYGLSICGQPMLAVAIWNLIKGDKKILSYIGIVFFGISSSLILTGYYILVFLFIFAIIFSVKQGFKKSIDVWIALILLTMCYLLCNIKLIYMTFFDGYVSMRIERIERSLRYMDKITETNFFKEVFGVFFTGQVHAASGHIYSYLTIIPMAIIAIIKAIKKDLSKSDKKYLKIIIGLLIYNFGAALINGLYYTDFVKMIIDHLGPLKGFQFHRMFLSYAVTWALIFALSLYLLITWECFSKLTFLKISNKAVAVILSAVLSITMSLAVLRVYEYISPDLGYYINVKKIFSKQIIDEDYPSYRQYVDNELFNSIKEHIGLNVAEYKVVSLGIYPAVASMNGFYTLDGFFQNYPLQYKHDFREIIEGELDKNNFLREYYDFWGNKCYILSSETVLKYKFSKQAGIKIVDLDINTAKLKEMGGEYIFSAVKIENFEELNLSFESYFTTPQSYWGIYLYKVNNIR